eukprot:EC792063.1.p2 GENE.EC792063.1~~EC792063.1.p2  ORF type:complete len:73 (+),score=13.81 EC792063.1:277-495(+)
MSQLLQILNTGDVKQLLKINQVGKKTAEGILRLRAESSEPRASSRLEDLINAGMKPGNIRTLFSSFMDKCSQ